MSPFEARRLAEARIGMVLREKWHIDRVLGTGGFGVVYAATHRAGKRVAVKLLHPQLSSDPDIRKRFMREAYAANIVDHPGAVSVLDDDVTEEGAAFLVMDLLEGETLEARRTRKGGTLPPDEVLSIADQVLDVLVAAHAKGVIHRDLKPENVFLTREGSIKVLDFGIARIREPQGGSATTQLGAAMGTPAFMPPEQARGRWELVDGRTDLWALGATMFTLLSGRFVHGALNTYEALGAAMMTPAPSVATAVAALPPQVAALVDRALAFEKEERWPDAHAMQIAVREAYHTSTGAAPLLAPRASVLDPEESTTLRGAPLVDTPEEARGPVQLAAQTPSAEGGGANAAVVGASPVGSTSMPLSMSDVRSQSELRQGTWRGRTAWVTWLGVGIGIAVVGLAVGLTLYTTRLTDSVRAREAQTLAAPLSGVPLPTAPPLASAPSATAMVSAPATTASVAVSGARSTAPAVPQSKPTSTPPGTTKRRETPMATPY